MGSSSPRLPFAPALAVAGGMLAGCVETGPTLSSPYEATGEIIALSGGDAGAKGACVVCHGLEGEGDGNLVPRLAGMERGYFLRQMEHFATGQRRHPQMSWIAGRTDWPARQRLAIHYQDLPPPIDTDSLAVACSTAIDRLYQRGASDRGIAACAACHGEAGLAGGPGNPSLAGQPAPYIAEQLRQWRRGGRYGDPDGTMTAVSRLLAESEVEPLADYIAALPGASSYPGSRAACPRTRRRDPRSGA